MSTLVGSALPSLTIWAYSLAKRDLACSSCGGLRHRGVARLLGRGHLGGQGLRLMPLGREEQEPVGQDDDHRQQQQHDLPVSICEAHEPPPSATGTFWPASPRPVTVTGARFTVMSKT